MKVCAVICRKATLQLPDADYLSSQCQSQSSRAQNRDFCALLPARTLDFRRFEHKIGVFVRFLLSEPLFSGISSTKSRFLCALRLWSPRFQAFRAQNRGFCALLPARTLDFRRFEHKIGIFVRFWGLEALFSGILSTKSRFLCAFCFRNTYFQAFRAQNRGFCAL